jgi:hypothetical protein
MGCVSSKPKAKEPGKPSEQKKPLEEKPAASSNAPVPAPVPVSAAKPNPQPFDPKAPSLRASGTVNLAAKPPRILSYPNIVLLSGGKALIYDCSKRVCKAPVVLQAALKLTEGSAWLWLPDTQLLFLEGGSGQATCLDLTNGAGTAVKPMTQARTYPGLVYYERRVLVFGGTSEPLAEQYDLNQKGWAPLPNMHRPRNKFNPCLYDTLVYLCGGCTWASEIYNIPLNKYVALGFSVPDTYDACSVLVDLSIVIVSRDFLSKWSLDSEELSVRGRALASECWSSTPPVVVGNNAYILVRDQVMEVDLTTSAHSIVETDEEPRILASD